jgi:hypothetical protein
VKQINWKRMQVLDLHPEKQLYMKRNLGSGDRAARVLLVIILVTFILFEVIPPGAPAIFAWLAGVELLLTSFMYYSPLYNLIGINSWAKNNSN